MSLRVSDQVIHIEGNSPVEDAEPLLAALLESPDRIVDLSQAIRLHGAVFQLLLALRPAIAGLPGDPFQARHLAALAQMDHGTATPELGDDGAGKSG